MFTCFTLDDFKGKCDLYAHPFYLKVKGKDKLGTGAGLVFTLITLAIGLGAFLYQFDQLNQGRNPNITMTQRKFMGPRSYDIPKNSYQNAIGMVDKDFNPILNTVAKTYYELYYDICDETTCQRINSERCTDEFIQFHYEEFGMDPNMFKYTYCMNQTYYQNNEIQLEGGSYSFTYKRLNIVVERCVNKTNADYICASIEEQNEKMKNSVIIYGLQDFEFNPDNYDNPFKEIYQMNVQFIKIDDPKESLVGYHVSTVVSETNFYVFFPQQTKVTNLEMYNIILERSIDTRNVRGKIVIMLHENGITRTRTYQNIFNLLGTLGGFMDIVMIVCKVLVIPFNWLEQRLYLINFIHKSDLSILDLAKSKKSRKRFHSKIGLLMKNLEISYMLYFLQEGSSLLRISDTSIPNQSQWGQLASNFPIKNSQKNFTTTTKRAETFSDIPDEADYDRNKIIVLKDIK